MRLRSHVRPTRVSRVIFYSWACHEPTLYAALTWRLVISLVQVHKIAQFKVAVAR